MSLPAPRIQWRLIERNRLRIRSGFPLTFSFSIPVWRKPSFIAIFHFAAPLVFQLFPRNNRWKDKNRFFPFARSKKDPTIFLRS